MADYLTTDTELTSIADAIRAKGGTSAPLVYPTGFVSAINDISSGGSSGMVITVSGSSSTGYTLDKTGREILNCLNAGVLPVFSYLSPDGYQIRTSMQTFKLYPTGIVQVSSTSSGYYSNFTASTLDGYPSVAGSGGGDN